VTLNEKMIAAQGDDAAVARRFKGPRARRGFRDVVLRPDQDGQRDVERRTRRGDPRLDGPKIGPEDRLEELDHLLMLEHFRGTSARVAEHLEELAARQRVAPPCDLRARSFAADTNIASGIGRPAACMRRAASSTSSAPMLWPSNA
jgi:hypothetical protein